MLIAEQLKRVFLLKNNGQDVILDDPQPKWSPEAVQNFHSHNYPMLTTAKVSGPVIKDDTVQYVFESIMGTKG